MQSRIKALDKIERIELPKKRRGGELGLPHARRVPATRWPCSRASPRAYGTRAVYKDFDLTIRRGERWCVMGKNGAGKSTLLKMIAGAGQPDAGSVRLGASLNMGYFAQQSLDLLDPDLTVFEQLQQDFPQDGIGSLRTLARRLPVLAATTWRSTSAPSPAARSSRLAMARMLYNPPNFLVLDEPTNHLDLATKEMLVEALKDFEGTMIFVSHDRMFLRGPA